ncbi:MAG TPA: transglutaminase-like domain-containing protein [Acidimicrobiales bacterium]|nr:transglutaminase-like domain-containing protein [Acidimicrobiales bacterium]
MDPTGRFAELVAGPEAAIPLDEACLLVAAHARAGAGDLDLASEQSRLDELARTCARGDLASVLHQLFEVHGFTGDRETYDDPRNSLLDQVLDRRRGLPITLSVLLIEVGRRAGVGLVGIGMPGHFLARTAAGSTFVDAFEGGALLDEQGCEDRFRAVHGAEEPFDAAYLAPVGPRQILARLLANLRSVYGRRGDLADLAWVLRLRSAIPGVDPRELEHLAHVETGRGRFRAAADAMEQLGRRLGDDPGRDAEAEARRLRARLN